MVLELAVLLRTRCTAEFQVLIAPFDVALDDTTVLPPDVLVANRQDLTDRDLPVAPLLAVEVLIPSTRHIDLMLKRSRYETAGCPTYWVIDPDEPSLVVWQSHDGRYAEQAHVVGEELGTRLNSRSRSRSVLQSWSPDNRRLAHPSVLHVLQPSRHEHVARAGQRDRVSRFDVQPGVGELPQ